MKKTLPWLWLIFLCAFFLRVYNLDAVSLRGDEAFTVNFVQRTWDALWKGIRFIEPNPPGLYLALRAWVALAGASELVARFFSVWFGVLNSALIYRLARAMIPNPKIKNLAALIAALLIAFSPYQIWHSQDVRNYTLWPAVSMLALIFFWRVWRLEVGSWKLEVGNALYASRFTFYALYFLSAYLALMTFYYETFIVVAQNVFFAISFVRAGGLRDLKRAGRALARWSAAQIVLIAAYGAWILQTDRVTAYGELSAEQSVGLLDMLTRTVASFVLGDTVPDAYQHALAPIVTIALIACLIVWARQDHARAIFIALYVAVPLVGVYLTSLGRPLFSERYITGI
ncbi:MAG: hypothetical protein HY070_01675, partial [Chloroflexi bacterium]|nr:hypothetical protein [Chloroflexota bacterium]